MRAGNNQLEAGIATHATPVQELSRTQGPSAEIKKLFSNRTWVSPEAYPQLERVAKLPGMIYVAAMPDLHPGTGSPGGAAFVSQELLHPRLIGGDIGCGMKLCTTSIDARANVQRLSKKLSGIDGAWDGDLGPLLEQYKLQPSAYDSALGTIGGGNHFAELQVIEEVRDKRAIDELGIRPDKALLLIHSGSRGLGQSVLNRYNEQSSGSPLAPQSQQGQEYLTGHAQALQYAQLNRALIADRIAQKLGASADPVLDLSHNFLEQRESTQGPVWIHRKGAAPSDRGLVVIPGSRGSYTYLVRPLGNGEVNAFSLAHGAGRKISRSQCDDKFSQLSPHELLRSKDKDRGIDNLVICENQSLLRQEHGKAYKDIDRVIGDLASLGLVEVVAIFKPIMTYKTRSESDDGEG